MKALERRLSALEISGGRADPELRLLLDALSDADLNRLEELIIDRDAGRWCDVDELGDADLRLLARIRVVPCAA